MILTSILVALLIIAFIAYLLYNKNCSDSAGIICGVTTVIGIIIIIATVIGWVSSYGTASYNQAKTQTQKEGLEFSAQNLVTYTDKLELANSSLFVEITSFNADLAARQAYSHNPVTGWFISDYADSITPIDLNILLGHPSKKLADVTQNNYNIPTGSDLYIDHATGMTYTAENFDLPPI